MKAIVSVLCIVVLVGGIYMLSSGGCKAQTQVAGDKVMERINEWLGDLDVKRKEIANTLKTVETGMSNVRQQRISGEVRMEGIQKKVATIETRIGDIKKALAELNPHLRATEAVEINGKSFAPEKVREMANELADEFEALNRKLGGLQLSIKEYQRSVSLLATQEQTAEKTIKALKEKLELIDIKKETLDSMQSARTIVGESGSISDEFVKLEKDIDNLFIEVETGLRVESEKVADRERELASSTSTVDEILGDLTTDDETAARIEAILGADSANNDSGKTPEQKTPDEKTPDR